MATEHFGIGQTVYRKGDLVNDLSTEKLKELVKKNLVKQVEK